METIYRVFVKELRGEKVAVNLCRNAEQFKNMTVRQLKEKIWETLPEFGEKHLWLIFRGKAVDEDDALLSDYGIQHNSVIHMVPRITGGGGPIDENSGMGDKTGKNRSMESLKLSF